MLTRSHRTRRNAEYASATTELVLDVTARWKRSGEKQAQCPWCQKNLSLAKISNAKQHMLTHVPKGTLHFQCDNCGATFTNKGNQSRHRCRSDRDLETESASSASPSPSSPGGYSDLPSTPMAIDDHEFSGREFYAPLPSQCIPFECLEGYDMQPTITVTNFDLNFDPLLNTENILHPNLSHLGPTASWQQQYSTYQTPLYNQYEDVYLSSDTYFSPN